MKPADDAFLAACNALLVALAATSAEEVARTRLTIEEGQSLVEGMDDDTLRVNLAKALVDLDLVDDFADRIRR